jgi:hypothetical protein
MARAANTKGVDAAVMARLRAPFGCEFIYGADDKSNRWRIHDANDDAIASVSGREEGYARLIVAAINREFDHRKPAPVSGSPEEVAELRVVAKAPPQMLEQKAELEAAYARIKELMAEAEKEEVRWELNAAADESRAHDGALSAFSPEQRAELEKPIAPAPALDRWDGTFLNCCGLRQLAATWCRLCRLDRDGKPHGRGA